MLNKITFPLYFAVTQFNAFRVCLILAVAAIVMLATPSSALADPGPLAVVGCGGGCVGGAACVVYALICGIFSVDPSIFY